MILYKDNPKLRLKVITTVKGDSEYRRNCRYIRDKYYLIDRDCFNINETWYTYDGGNITFDYEKEVWLLNEEAESLTKGVVGFQDDGSIIMGQFTLNPYNNVKCRTKSGILTALNSDILLKDGWVEDVAHATWFSKHEIGGNGVRSARTIRNHRGFTDRGYNIEDNAKDFKRKVQLYEEYKPQITKDVRTYAKFLGDTSFGAEIEIAKGNLADNLQNRTGVVICRDGSIDGGPELVTIPIIGSKGVQTLVDLANYLETRGEISIACSFHLHFGNIRKDKLFQAAIYQLCRKIQDELFTMFPYYKTDHKGIKRRNYNQKLESLGIHPLVKTDKDSFEAYLVDTHARIFDFLVEGKITLDEFNKRTREHPIPRKWDRSNRYYWVNFMNMFFGHRHTAEFRLHQGTTNPHKIVNWLYICNAILRYADRYSTEIIRSKDSISVKEILDIYRTSDGQDKKAAFLSDYLYEYFLTRQAEFKKDLDKGDKLSEWDMTEDKKYRFSYKGVCGLF